MFDVAPKSCQKEGDNDFDGEQSGELTPGVSQDIVTREVIDYESTVKHMRGGSDQEDVAPAPAPFILDMQTNVRGTFKEPDGPTITMPAEGPLSVRKAEPETPFIVIEEENNEISQEKDVRVEDTENSTQKRIFSINTLFDKGKGA